MHGIEIKLGFLQKKIKLGFYDSLTYICTCYIRIEKSNLRKPQQSMGYKLNNPVVQCYTMLV